MKSDAERFEDWVAKQESSKKNWRANLEGADMLRKFKAKFSVGNHLNGIHCPFCTMRQLFLKEGTENEYLCRDCLGEIVLEIKFRPEKTKVEEALAKTKEQDLKELEDSVLGEDDD